MRRFGCEAYAYLHPDKRPKPGKFEPRAVKGIYLGPTTDRNMSAHKVWDPVGNKIYLTTQVRFNENLLPLRPNKLTTRATPDVDMKVFDLEPEVKLVSYDADLMARHLKADA